jgi:hypothetical protein
MVLIRARGIAIQIFSILMEATSHLEKHANKEDGSYVHRANGSLVRFSGIYYQTQNSESPTVQRIVTY